MTTMLISEFKAKCIEVLNRVHDEGDIVVVTRRGKPLVKIVSVKEKAPEKRLLAETPGEFNIKGDIVETNLESDWEALS